MRKHHVGLSAAARACELADAELLLHLTTAPSPPIAAGAYLPPLLRVELSRSRANRRPVVDSDQLRPPFVDSSASTSSSPAGSTLSPAIRRSAAIIKLLRRQCRDPQALPHQSHSLLPTERRFRCRGPLNQSSLSPYIPSR